MKILIVDDEPLARARLRALLEELSEHDICGEAANGRQALDMTRVHKPDLVLMDIGMPGMSGMDAVTHFDELDYAPLVIFITAYHDFALEAFDNEAVDYLLKPVRKERLQKALARARALFRAPHLPPQSGNARTHISATVHGNLRLIPVDKIYYFRADQKYVALRWPDGEVLLDNSLRHLEDEFAGQFLRIHRNALVAVVYVRALEKDREGRVWICFQDIKDKLEVSRRHLSAVKRVLQDFRGSLPGYASNETLLDDNFRVE
jgi:two-component system, LytTR family, response regulator AlgR